MKYVFDIETNGLLDTLTTIHCIVLINIETEELLSFRPTEVDKAIKLLSEAKLICGHNIINFDLPAIKKLNPGFETKAKIVDTMICSRLIWSDIKNTDFQNYQRYGFQSKMIGSHALKAWGLRLNLRKGDFGESNDWSTWSEDMQKYCERDVELNYKFYQIIEKKNYSQQALDLEHDFAKVIELQQKHGFTFNREAANDLLRTLIKRRIDLEQELQDAFPPWDKQLEDFIPARDNKTKGYTKGIPVQRHETVTFNPNSRQHIANRLIEKYEWKPKDFTNDGKPQVDETVLSKLEYKEAKILSEYLLIQKRISQLAEGNSAWLKLEKQGKLHGSVITNGAVTGRCTHRSPNIAQVPRVGSPYGEDCRALFIADEGFKLCGIDVASLELRALSHYLARYDNGEYAKIVNEGDIHTFNQKAANLPSRNLAKTMIYALIYGAGDARMGEIIEGSSKEGKQLKEKLFKQIPALSKLTRDVRDKVARTGVLKAIDGRLLNIRSSHSALNFLIQSCGSIIVKQATINLHEVLFYKYKYGKDFAMVAHVHDEMQLQVREDIAEDVGRLAVKAVKDTQKIFGLRCPLDAEYKIGSNWAETH